MAKKYIDTEKLKLKVNHEMDMQDTYLPVHFLDIVDDMPAADVVEVKHGRWIKNDGRYGWHCSVCGEDDLYAFSWNSDTGENELQDRYCPNCGAKMDEGERNED